MPCAEGLLPLSISASVVSDSGVRERACSAPVSGFSFCLMNDPSYQKIRFVQLVEFGKSRGSCRASLRLRVLMLSQVALQWRLMGAFTTVSLVKRSLAPAASGRSIRMET